MTHLLFFLLAFAANDETDIIENMTVEYVMLDVFAHDASGDIVVDLSKDDFEVKEGRKHVDIDLFDVIDYRFAPSPAELQKMKQEAGPDADEIQVHPQTMILVLEFSTAEVNQIRDTMDNLKTFFSDLQVRPNINFFVVSLDHGQVTQTFTNRPEVIYQKLAEYEQTVMKDPGGNLLFTRQTKLDYLEEQLSECMKYITGYQNSSGGDVFQPENSGSKTAQFNNCITSAHDQFVNIHVAHTSGILKSLEQLIAVFAQLPGMKSMYFVSPGFSLKPGAEGSALSRSYADRIRKGTYTSSNQSSSGQRATPANISTVNMTNAFRRVIHAATANRIVFHTFRFGGQDALDRMDAEHTAGLNEDTSLFFGQFSEEMNRGLDNLAETTGGEFAGEAALGPALKHVMDSHSFQYVIGYKKPSGGKRFRSIHLSCKRPDVKLSYRSGYYPNPKKAK